MINFKRYEDLEKIQIGDIIAHKIYCDVPFRWLILDRIKTRSFVFKSLLLNKNLFINFSPTFAQNFFIINR